MAPSPHDSIVKLAFSNPTDAAAELQVALPAELTKACDWSTLAVEQGSFVNRALDKSYSDILYSVHFAEVPAYLYVLFEHKSFTDPLLALSLARYVLRVLDMHVKRFGERLPLPPVIAVVLHHTKDGWSGGTDLLWDQLLDEFQDDLSLYRPEGGTHLIDEAAMMALVQRTLETLKARSVGGAEKP